MGKGLDGQIYSSPQSLRIVDKVYNKFSHAAEYIAYACLRNGGRDYIMKSYIKSC